MPTLNTELTKNYNAVQAMFENTYFSFFQISKNMTFYVFLKWRIKKS